MGFLNDFAGKIGDGIKTATDAVGLTGNDKVEANKEAANKEAAEEEARRKAAEEEARRKAAADEQARLAEIGSANAVFDYNLLNESLGSAQETNWGVIRTGFNAGKAETGTEQLPVVNIDSGTAAGADGKKPEVKATTTPVPGDPFDYDQWWAVYQSQQANKSVETAKPGVDTPPTEKGWAETVANWVGDSWDSLWAGGKAGQYKTTDAKGNEYTTTMSDRGVDRAGSDGSVSHSDGRGTVERNAKGDTAYRNNQTGETGEKLRNGTEVRRNSDGTFTVVKDGREVRVNAEGDLEATVNGRKVQIDSEFIRQEVNGWKVNQTRRSDGRTGEQEEQASRPTSAGEPTMTTVEDKEDGTQMIVINDGNGNTLKLRRNGERIMSSAENPDLALIANKNDDTIRVKVKDQEFYLKRQEGGDAKDRWYLYKSKDGRPEDVIGWIGEDGTIQAYDPNDKSKVGETLGRVQGLNQATGEIQQGTATVAADGTVRTQGAAANVEITDQNEAKLTGPDGKTLVGTNAAGDTSQVTHTNNQGKSDSTSVNPGAGTPEDPSTYEIREDVQVNAETGEPVTDEAGNITSGTTVVKVEGQDEKGKDVTQINAGDVDGDGKDDFIRAEADPDGSGVRMYLPNGDWFDGDGVLNRENGTKFYTDGKVSFADGTEIDANGNVTNNGKYMGSAGGYGAGSEAAAAARVSAILALAASIGSGFSVDRSKIGQLEALFGQLGVAQGVAMQAGDMGAFIAADLAKSVVAGAITHQEAILASAKMAEVFAGNPLTADQINQVQRGAPNASPELIKALVEPWKSEQKTEQPQPAGVR